MNDDERRKFLVEWNATDHPAPVGSVVDALRRVAEHAPDSLAIASGATRLTYAELERSSNRLARLLRARGVRDEDRVATFFERSAEMIVAQLAIMKAGGAFLPLDPARDDADHAREPRPCGPIEGSELFTPDLHPFGAPDGNANLARPTHLGGDFGPEMLHFMAMPDAVSALVGLLEPDRGKLAQSVYDIRGFSVSAAQIAERVKKSFPGADLVPTIRRRCG
jgi:hypothetical protein